MQESSGKNLDDTLTDTHPISIFTVSGKLNLVLDVSDSAALEAFTRLIKDFKISRTVQYMDPMLSKKPLYTIRTPEELRKTLLNVNWHKSQAQFDLPGNPQIFGQLAFDAGLEGIVVNPRPTPS